MPESVYWVVEFAINPGRFEDWKSLVAAKKGESTILADFRFELRIQDVAGVRNG